MTCAVKFVIHLLPPGTVVGSMFRISGAQLSAKVTRGQGSNGFSLFVKKAELSSTTFQSGQRNGKQLARMWRLLPRRERLAMMAKNSANLATRNESQRHDEAHANTEYNVVMKLLFSQLFPKDFFSGEMAGNIAGSTVKVLNASQLKWFRTKFHVAKKTKVEKKKNPTKAPTNDSLVPQNLQDYSSFGQMFRHQYGRLSERRLFVLMSLVRSKRCQENVAAALDQEFDHLSDEAKGMYATLSPAEEAAFSDFCFRNGWRYEPSQFFVLDLFAAFRGIGWIINNQPPASVEAAFRHISSLERVQTPSPRKLLSLLKKLSTTSSVNVYKSGSAQVVDPSTYKPAYTIDEADLVKKIVERRGDESVYEFTVREAMRYYNYKQKSLICQYPKE